MKNVMFCQILEVSSSCQSLYSSDPTKCLPWPKLSQVNPQTILWPALNNGPNLSFTMPYLPLFSLLFEIEQCFFHSEMQKIITGHEMTESVLFAKVFQLISSVFYSFFVGWIPHTVCIICVLYRRKAVACPDKCHHKQCG